ncbi:unnamed protein product [Cylicocyclus nassatus]|uniref:Uncharacterized protein n=1 Tax=Cylicocyclus nassatus TaxID=53992 RepID=A0AA36HBH7_CYLNA|nr:unnamed protein product [Cylicocyclus nassatus]
MAFSSSVHASQYVNDVGVRRYGDFHLCQRSIQLRLRENSISYGGIDCVPQDLTLQELIEVLDRKKREPHDYVEMEESWAGEGNYFENEPPQQQSARMTAYEEFTNSDMATRARLCLEGFERIEGAEAMRLGFTAVQLQADLTRVQLSQTRRTMDVTNTALPESTLLKVVSTNCCKCWLILNNAASDWIPRPRDCTYQQITSLYRSVLQLTEEDAMSLGHDELRKGNSIDLVRSKFYQGLGSNNAERNEELEQMTRERAKWRLCLYRSLQKALGYIRAYIYDEVAGSGSQAVVRRECYSRWKMLHHKPI